MPTEAKKRANLKYKASKAHIDFTIDMELKEKIKERATELNLSINGYLVNLVETDLKGMD